MAAKKLSQPLLILTTVSSLSEARRLARGLLKRRLVGCVNVIPGIRSFYWWKGRVEQGKELLLFLKTTRHRLPALSRFVKAAHSYDVPELVALPFSWGHPLYLKWLRDSVETVL